MPPDARNSSVRLGRKLVHGRRVQPVAAVEEAQAVLVRLPGDSARSARSLLRRALASESIPGIMVRPQEENAALVLAACGILRLEEKAEGDAAVYHWRPYRAALADGRRDEVRILLGKLDPDEARAGLLHAIAATPELSRERELLSELLRAFRTGDLRLIHAAACPFRYSSRTSCGVRYPSPEWRRVLL
jgi:hypothetical protein